MKFLAAAAFCLSCAVFAVTAQVVMVLREARPSSQNPRLEILSRGKLQPGANLAVYNADDEQKLSFKADSHGMATLPDLPAGRYCIAGDTAHPLKITTDQQGHFSASLAPGKYAAVIESPGFETNFLTFEISPDAVQEDLNVKLNIGAIA
jgi:hypothetical protein